MAFRIKQGNTRPSYIVALKDNVGEETEAALDLTTVDKVTFLMRASGEAGAAVVEGEAQVVGNPKDGVVGYEWKAGDLDVDAGKYDAEFLLEYEGGGLETVPNEGYFEIVVNDDLDD